MIAIRSIITLHLEKYVFGICMRKTRPETRETNIAGAIALVIPDSPKYGEIHLKEFIDKKKSF